MNLLKKIATIAAAGLLSAGLAYNVLAEEESFIGPKTEEETKVEIEKEAKNYQSLFTGLEGEEVVLEWDRDNDGTPDLKCYYHVKDMFSETDFLLNLNRSYEKKENSGEYELMKEGNSEHQKYFLSFFKGIFVFLGKDENGDKIEDRRYVYFSMGKEKRDSINGVITELMGIQKDRNNDGYFKPDEFIWEMGESNPEPETSPTPFPGQELDPDKII